MFKGSNVALITPFKNDKLEDLPNIFGQQKNFLNIYLSLQKLNFPILIGASRKRFIGDILNEINPKERDIGTLAITCLCSQLNINLIRVHNVKINYQILKVADRIYR